MLTANEWFYVSLITEDTYKSDGFLDAFYRLTRNTSVWRVEDHISIPHRSTLSAIDYHLLNLLENQSRVVVLHCSPRLARTVFQVAEMNGIVRGYAWFVTEDVTRSQRSVIDAFPVGLVAIRLSSILTPRNLIPDTVRLIAKAFDRLHDKAVQLYSSATSRPLLRHSGPSPSSCWSYTPNNSGDELYR